MPKHKNILPNTYVPVFPKSVLVSVLKRLPKSSLIALTALWPQLKNTQPRLPKENAHHSQTEYNLRVREEAKQMKENPTKWNKSRIIDRILFEHWVGGLNLLQLAQVDCQLIVDNPNAYFWILSTVKDAWGHEVCLSLNPLAFLNRLALQLSNIFMSYIYVCTHPTFPLVLIRIQVFDLLPGRSLAATRLEKPHITSHKPHFLAIPMNSPHLIHSPSNDLVSEVVLQVVESCLEQTPKQPLHLETPKTQKAVRSLESMQILKGNSRFSNSLGAWAPYADGVADISPLASFDKHSAVPQVVETNEACTTEEEKTKKLANVRFKGTTSGEYQSERMFDHPLPVKKARRDNPLDADGEDENVRRFRADLKNEFRSIAPIRYAQYNIQEEIVPGQPNEDRSNVVLKLVGTDVFAGLHELSVKLNEEKSVVNLKKLPGWLTGEEGTSCGVVRDGKFTSSD